MARKLKEKKPPAETPFESVWFTWPVPNRGYTWTEEAKPVPEGRAFGKTPKGQPPYLIENPKATVHVRKFPLRDCPDLFSDFEALEPTPEDIQDFANKYGWLGIGDILYYPHRDRGSTVFQGEGLECWQDEIATIQICAKISEWIDSRNESELSKRIEWAPSGHGVRFRWTAIGREPITPISPLDVQAVQELAKRITQRAVTRDQWIADKNHLTELFASWTPGDVFAPASAWLVQEVNKNIQGKVWVGLILDQRGERQPVVRADNLLAAIWSQFYSHLIGEKKVVRCEVCRRWMDVTHSRRNKRMHSRCSMWLRNQRREPPGGEKSGKKKTRTK